MSKPRTINLFGYQGKHPAHLLDACTRLDLVLWDIRMSPRSRNPEWSKASLSRLFGVRYRHIPQLGNPLYRTAAIALNDPEAALALFDIEIRGIVLMCVCEHTESCHRSAAAAFLVQQRGVVVLELADALAAREPRQLGLLEEEPHE